MANLLLIPLVVLALDSLEAAHLQLAVPVYLVDLVVVPALRVVVWQVLTAEVHIKAALGEGVEGQLVTPTLIWPLVLVGLTLMPLVVAAQRGRLEPLVALGRLALVMAVKAAVAAALLVVPLVGLVALVPFLAVVVAVAAVLEMALIPAQVAMAAMARSACIAGKEAHP